MIKCPLCGIEKYSLVSHLKLIHKVNIKEFRKSYPNLKLQIPGRHDSIIKCLQCGKEFNAGKIRGRQFCGQSCSCIYTNKNKRNYEYMKGDNNPAKNPNVGKKISNKLRINNIYWGEKTNGLLRYEVFNMMKYLNLPDMWNLINNKTSWCSGLTKDNCEPLRRVSEKLKGRFVGDKNPAKRPDVKDKITKKLLLSYQLGNHKHIYKYGKDNPLYIEGKGHYNTVLWTRKLKEKIRKRDGYRCQQCFRHQDELYYQPTGKKYKLNIHHIDYNKNNCDENNLISLCRTCHSQTNFKREDWTQYFKNKLYSDLK